MVYSPRPLDPHFPLALGTSPLGVGTEAGTPEGDAAVTTALALLREPAALIDTSNNYAGTRSEAVLGEALAALTAEEHRSAAARLITKVDEDPDTGRFDGDRVRRSLEESLTRLGLDTVPLLHLHDPYGITVAEAMAPGGAGHALVQLREEGLVARIGIAAGPVPLLARYVETGAFDAVLCHNRMTLVDDSALPLYADARARGMITFNAAPYGAGLLVRGAVPGVGYGYQPASAELLDWTRAVEKLCAAHGVPLAALALQFSLRSPLIDCTVVGVSSPERLRTLHSLRDHDIPAELWDAVAALPPAPTPVDDRAYGEDS